MIKQKIKIDPLDKLFSAYIRTRDGWTCRRCKQEFDPATRSQLLDCSHIIPRGSWSIRLDERNALALCKWKCHKWWHSNPVEATQWLMNDMMTLAEYQALKLRASQIGCKRKNLDVRLIELELLQKIDGQFEQLNDYQHQKCPDKFIDAAMEYLLLAKNIYLGSNTKEVKLALRKQG